MNGNYEVTAKTVNSIILDGVHELYNEQIETIVTKEMFQNCEYKVGE